MNSLTQGSHSVTVHGTRMAYHVAGTGPVMVAHSGGPGVIWSYLRSRPLEEHFTMVYLEPPGTGDSGPLPEDATYVDTYADYLHALVEHLRLDRMYLLGHSHGGLVVLRFALRWPGKAAGIVLYSTPTITTDDFWLAAEEAARSYPERHPDVTEALDVVKAIEADDNASTPAAKRSRRLPSAT